MSAKRSDVLKAMASGELDDMLAVAGRPPQAPGTQKGTTWIRKASEEQVSAALINGDLRDLLANEPGWEPDETDADAGVTESEETP